MSLKQVKKSTKALFGAALMSLCLASASEPSKETQPERNQSTEAKSADSSSNGHSFQCFVDSALISFGQLSIQLGQSATGQKQTYLARYVIVFMPVIGSV